MNIKKMKTKILVSGREKQNTVVTLKGQKLEQVDSFSSLRSTITLDGRSSADIKGRIAQAGSHGGGYPVEHPSSLHCNQS
jgi:hypothetical protein